MVAGKSLTQWRPELHPRDRNGRFRDKWGLSKAALADLDAMLAGFNSRDFKDDAEAAKFLRSLRRARTKKQQDALDYFLTPDGNADIQSTLRAHGDERAPGFPPEVHQLDSMMQPLTEDLLVTRVLGPDAFGLPADRIADVEEWTGKLAMDYGYSPTNVGTPHEVSGPHITMSMVVPKGTKAIVLGNGENRTVILDREQQFRIIRFQPDGRGGFYAITAIAPKMKAKDIARPLGQELSKKDVAPAVDATPEEAAKRGVSLDETPLSQTPLDQPAGFPGSEKAPSPPPTSTIAAPTKAIPPPPPDVPGSTVPASPDQALPPAKAIKKAGKAVPRGAGRVTREGDTEPEEDTRLDPRKRPSRQVMDPEEARLAQERRELERQRKEVQEERERLDRRKTLQLREEERRADKAIARARAAEAEAEALRRQVENGEAAPARKLTTSTQGRPQAADMSPAQRRSVTNRVRRLRAEHEDFPRNDNEQELSDIADDIEALRRGEAPTSPVAKAAKKAPAPPKKAPTKAPVKAPAKKATDRTEEEADELRARQDQVDLIDGAVQNLGTRTGSEAGRLASTDLASGRKGVATVAGDIRRAATRLRLARRFRDEDVLKQRRGETFEELRDKDVSILSRLADDLDGGAGAKKAQKVEAAKKARQQAVPKRIRKAAEAPEPTAEEAEAQQLDAATKEELIGEAAVARRAMATQRGFLAARRAEQALKGDRREAGAVVKQLREEVDTFQRLDLSGRQITKRGAGESDEDIRAKEMARLSDLADAIEARLPATRAQKRATKKAAAETTPETEKVGTKAGSRLRKGDVVQKEDGTFDTVETVENTGTRIIARNANGDLITEVSPSSRVKVRRPVVAKAAKAVEAPETTEPAKATKKVAKKVAPEDAPVAPKVTPAKKATATRFTATERAQIAKTASELHEKWRSTQQLLDDGTRKPKFKSTKDQAWIDAHGTDQVDIANTSYDGLPDDWKGENRDAAEAVHAILKRRGGKVDLDDEETRLEVGEEIHQAWLSRPNNSYAKGGPLDVPFRDLPTGPTPEHPEWEDEQGKDIDQMRIALRSAAKKVPGAKKVAPKKTAAELESEQDTRIRKATRSRVQADIAETERQQEIASRAPGAKKVTPEASAKKAPAKTARQRNREIADEIRELEGAPDTAENRRKMRALRQEQKATAADLVQEDQDATRRMAEAARAKRAATKAPAPSKRRTPSTAEKRGRRVEELTDEIRQLTDEARAARRAGDRERAKELTERLDRAKAERTQLNEETTRAFQESERRAIERNPLFGRGEKKAAPGKAAAKKAEAPAKKTTPEGERPPAVKKAAERLEARKAAKAATPAQPEKAVPTKAQQDAQLKRLVRAYTEGASLRELEQASGRSSSAIGADLTKKAGLQLRQRGGITRRGDAVTQRIDARKAKALQAVRDAYGIATPEAAPEAPVPAKKVTRVAKKAAPGATPGVDLTDEQVESYFLANKDKLSDAEQKDLSTGVSVATTNSYWRRRAGGQSHAAALRSAKAEQRELDLKNQGLRPDQLTEAEERSVNAIIQEREPKMTALQRRQLKRAAPTPAGVDAYWEAIARDATHEQALEKAREATPAKAVRQGRGVAAPSAPETPATPAKKAAAKTTRATKAAKAATPEALAAPAAKAMPAKAAATRTLESMPKNTSDQRRLLSFGDNDRQALVRQRANEIYAEGGVTPAAAWRRAIEHYESEEGARDLAFPSGDPNIRFEARKRPAGGYHVVRVQTDPETGRVTRQSAVGGSHANYGAARAAAAQAAEATREPDPVIEAQRRNDRITAAKKAAKAASKVDQLIGDEADSDSMLRQMDQLVRDGDLTEPQRALLAKAVRSGRTSSIRRAQARIAEDHGLRPTSEAGRIEPYDRRVHGPIGADEPRPGEPVRVVRTGYRREVPDEPTLQVSKSIVERATPDEVLQTEVDKARTTPDLKAIARRFPGIPMTGLTQREQIRDRLRAALRRESRETDEEYNARIGRLRTLPEKATAPAAKATPAKGARKTAKKAADAAAPEAQVSEARPVKVTRAAKKVNPGGAAQVGDTPRARATRVKEYDAITRDEFDALPQERRDDIMDDIRSIRDSGDTRTIPSNRTSMGTTIRGATAPHVTKAQSLFDRFTRQRGEPKVTKKATPGTGRVSAAEMHERRISKDLDETGRPPARASERQQWLQERMTDAQRAEVDRLSPDDQASYWNERLATRMGIEPTTHDGAMYAMRRIRAKGPAAQKRAASDLARRLRSEPSATEVRRATPEPTERPAPSTDVMDRPRTAKRLPRPEAEVPPAAKKVTKAATKAAKKAKATNAPAPAVTPEPEALRTGPRRIRRSEGEQLPSSNDVRRALGLPPVGEDEEAPTPARRTRPRPQQSADELRNNLLIQAVEDGRNDRIAELRRQNPDVTQAEIDADPAIQSIDASPMGQRLARMRGQAPPRKGLGRLSVDQQEQVREQAAQIRARGDGGPANRDEAMVLDAADRLQTLDREAQLRRESAAKAIKRVDSGATKRTRERAQRVRDAVGNTDGDQLGLLDASIKDLANGESAAQVKRRLTERAESIEDRSRIMRDYPDADEIDRMRADSNDAIAARYRAAAKALGGTAGVGKISASELQPGDRILVSRDSSGRWVPATKKTGATVLTVSKKDTVGKGARPRLVVQGVDGDGNLITVSPSRGTANGITQATKFHLPTPPRAARERGPLLSDLKARARELEIPGWSRMRKTELERAIFDRENGLTAEAAPIKKVAKKAAKAAKAAKAVAPEMPEAATAAKATRTVRKASTKKTASKAAAKATPAEVAPTPERVRPVKITRAAKKASTMAQPDEVRGKTLATALRPGDRVLVERNVEGPAVPEMVRGEGTPATVRRVLRDGSIDMVDDDGQRFRTVGSSPTDNGIRFPYWRKETPTEARRAAKAVATKTATKKAAPSKGAIKKVAPQAPATEAPTAKATAKKAAPQRPERPVKVTRAKATKRERPLTDEATARKALERLDMKAAGRKAAVEKAAEPTYKEMREMAKKARIPRWSRLSADELKEAIGGIERPGRVVDLDAARARLGKRAARKTSAVDADVIPLKQAAKKVAAKKAAKTAEAPAAPTKAAPAKAARRVQATRPEAEDIFRRLDPDQPDGFKTREEAAEALANVGKADLLDMAKQFQIPGASRMSMANLKRGIVEAGVGRRLDSIATRGFRGRRPGQEELDTIPEPQKLVKAAKKAAPTRTPSPYERVDVAALAREAGLDPDDNDLRTFIQYAQELLDNGGRDSGLGNNPSPAKVAQAVRDLAGSRFHRAGIIRQLRADDPKPRKEIGETAARAKKRVAEANREADVLRAQGERARTLADAIAKVRRRRPRPEGVAPAKKAATKVTPATSRTRLTPEQRAASKAAVPEILRRFNDNEFQSRAEAAEALQAVQGREDLMAMARDLSIPRASTLTVADLRREIVDAGVGRRLASIATRGFEGPLPGSEQARKAARAVKKATPEAPAKKATPIEAAKARLSETAVRRRARQGLNADQRKELAALPSHQKDEYYRQRDNNVGHDDAVFRAEQIPAPAKKTASRKAAAPQAPAAKAAAPQKTLPVAKAQRPRKLTGAEIREQKRALDELDQEIAAEKRYTPPREKQFQTVSSANRDMDRAVTQEDAMAAMEGLSLTELRQVAKDRKADIRGAKDHEAIRRAIVETGRQGKNGNFGVRRALVTELEEAKVNTEHPDVVDILGQPNWDQNNADDLRRMMGRLQGRSNHNRIQAGLGGAKSKGFTEAADELDRAQEVLKRRLDRLARAPKPARIRPTLTEAAIDRARKVIDRIRSGRLPNNVDAPTYLGQRDNQQLEEIAQTLGIDLPTVLQATQGERVGRILDTIRMGAPTKKVASEISKAAKAATRGIGPSSDVESIAMRMFDIPDRQGIVDAMDGMEISDLRRVFRQHKGHGRNAPRTLSSSPKKAVQQIADMILADRQREADSAASARERAQKPEPLTAPSIRIASTRHEARQIVDGRVGLRPERSIEELRTFARKHNIPLDKAGDDVEKVKDIITDALWDPNDPEIRPTGGLRKLDGAQLGDLARLYGVDDNLERSQLWRALVERGAKATDLYDPDLREKLLKRGIQPGDIDPRQARRIDLITRLRAARTDAGRRRLLADVEGYELRALRDAVRGFDGDHPPVVFDPWDYERWRADIVYDLKPSEITDSDARISDALTIRSNDPKAIFETFERLQAGDLARLTPSQKRRLRAKLVRSRDRASDSVDQRRAKAHMDRLDAPVANVEPAPAKTAARAAKKATKTPATKATAPEPGPGLLQRVLADLEEDKRAAAARPTKAAKAATPGSERPIPRKGTGTQQGLFKAATSVRGQRPKTINQLLDDDDVVAEDYLRTAKAEGLRSRQARELWDDAAGAIRSGERLREVSRDLRRSIQDLSRTDLEPRDVRDSLDVRDATSRELRDARDQDVDDLFRVADVLDQVEAKARDRDIEANREYARIDAERRVKAARERLEEAERQAQVRKANKATKERLERERALTPPKGPETPEARRRRLRGALTRPQQKALDALTPEQKNAYWDRNTNGQEHAAGMRAARTATKATKAAPATKAAKKASPGPRINEDEPLRYDPEGDNSVMHGDSDSMGLARTLAKAGRNGSANRVMELRRDASKTLGREPTDEELDAPQRMIDELVRMRDAETDPDLKKAYDRAIRSMDAPKSDVDVNLPGDTPPELRRLIKDLARIPLARRGDEDRSVRHLTQRSQNIEGPSSVSQLRTLLQRFSDGELSRSRLEMEIGKILTDQRHESMEGALRMRSLRTRLDAPAPRGQRFNPLQQAIIDWSRKTYARGSGEERPMAARRTPETSPVKAVKRLPRPAPEAGDGLPGNVPALKEVAKDLGIPGYSRMRKEQLQEAIRQARAPRGDTGSPRVRGPQTRAEQDRARATVAKKAPAAKKAGTPTPNPELAELLQSRPTRRGPDTGNPAVRSRPLKKAASEAAPEAPAKKAARPAKKATATPSVADLRDQLDDAIRRRGKAFDDEGQAGYDRETPAVNAAGERLQRAAALAQAERERIQAGVPDATSDSDRNVDRVADLIRGESASTYQIPGWIDSLQTDAERRRLASRLGIDVGRSRGQALRNKLLVATVGERLPAKAAAKKATKAATKAANAAAPTAAKKAATPRTDMTSRLQPSGKILLSRLEPGDRIKPGTRKTDPTLTVDRVEEVPRTGRAREAQRFKVFGHDDNGNEVVIDSPQKNGWPGKQTFTPDLTPTSAPAAKKAARVVAKKAAPEAPAGTPERMTAAALPDGARVLLRQDANGDWVPATSADGAKAFRVKNTGRIMESRGRSLRKLNFRSDDGDEFDATVAPSRRYLLEGKKATQAPEAAPEKAPAAKRLTKAEVRKAAPDVPAAEQAASDRRQAGIQRALAQGDRDEAIRLTLEDHIQRENGREPTERMRQQIVDGIDALLGDESSSASRSAKATAKKAPVKKAARTAKAVGPEMLPEPVEPADAPSAKKVSKAAQVAEPIPLPSQSEVASAPELPPSTKKGLHEIRLPDGTLATRTSQNNKYTHAVLTRRDNGQIADLYDQQARDLDEATAAFERALETGDWSDFKRVPGGGSVIGGAAYRMAYKGDRDKYGTFPDQDPTRRLRNAGYRVGDDGLVEKVELGEFRGGRFQEIWKPTGKTLDEVIRDDSRARDSLDPDNDASIAYLRRVAGNLRSDATKLREAGPQNYFISRWSMSPQAARTAATGKSRDISSGPGYEHRVVEVGRDYSQGRDAGASVAGVRKVAKKAAPETGTPATKATRPTITRAAKRAAPEVPTAEPVTRASLERDVRQKFPEASDREVDAKVRQGLIDNQRKISDETSTLDEMIENGASDAALQEYLGRGEGIPGLTPAQRRKLKAAYNRGGTASLRRALVKLERDNGIERISKPGDRVAYDPKLHTIGPASERADIRQPKAGDMMTVVRSGHQGTPEGDTESVRLRKATVLPDETPTPTPPVKKTAAQVAKKAAPEAAPTAPEASPTPAKATRKAVKKAAPDLTDTGNPQTKATLEAQERAVKVTRAAAKRVAPTAPEPATAEPVRAAKKVAKKAGPDLTDTGNPQAKAILEAQERVEAAQAPTRPRVTRAGGERPGVTNLRRLIQGQPDRESAIKKLEDDKVLLLELKQLADAEGLPPMNDKEQLRRALAEKLLPEKSRSRPRSGREEADMIRDAVNDGLTRMIRRDADKAKARAVIEEKIQKRGWDRQVDEIDTDGARKLLEQYRRGLLTDEDMDHQLRIERAQKSRIDLPTDPEPKGSPEVDRAAARLQRRENEKTRQRRAMAGTEGPDSGEAGFAADLDRVIRDAPDADLQGLVRERLQSARKPGPRDFPDQGWEAARNSLLELGDITDRRQLRDRLRAVMKERGIDFVGTEGDKVPFDEGKYESIDGTDIKPGTQVDIVEPGIQFRDRNGEVVTIRRPQVRRARRTRPTPGEPERASRRPQPEPSDAIARGIARLAEGGFNDRFIGEGERTPTRKATRGSRRNPGPFSPLAVYSDSGDDEGVLRDRLGSLDIEQLRDIIAENGMDPARSVSRSNDRGKLVDRIVSLTKSRATKGEAFLDRETARKILSRRPTSPNPVDTAPAATTPVKKATAKKVAKKALPPERPGVAPSLTDRVLFPASTASRLRAQRPAGITEGGILSGTVGPNDTPADLLTEDSWPRAVPVVDLVLRNGYRIRRGSAWRQNGVTYIVEHDSSPEDRAYATKVVDRMRRHQESLPREARAYQRGYVATAGGNPQDQFWSEKYGIPDFKSAASTGFGTTTVWRAADQLEEAERHRATHPHRFEHLLDHEFGHSVDHLVPGQYSARSQEWQRAVEADNPNRVIDSIRPHIEFSTLIDAKRHQGLPKGVTSYGTASVDEDYAEAIWLYLSGVLGQATFRGSDGEEPVWFRDLFPARAAVLDQIFPEFGRQQRAAMERIRQLPRFRRWAAVPPSEQSRG